MQLPRQDLHHTRAAEARLAAAHARTGAALDAVEALRTEGAVDGVEDLALRDLLAAADDLAVGGLFADELLIVFLGERLRVEHAPARGDEVRLFSQTHQIPHQLRRHTADGRGGGEARGLDARAVDELLRALGLADDEFVVILMRAQTGEARDGLADGQMLDGRARLLDQVVQTLGGGVRALAVFDVDRRRADNGVAVDSRADQNALAELAGQLEDGV